MADVIRKATNRFTKGLVMDFSPENTKNELLTHALNATLLTFNGNELSLQNDMGNARVETAYLPDGYMPVGTCEYGGIIYIVSYNPLEDKSLIGCFPSPERNVSSKELGKEDVVIDKDYFQETEEGVLTGTLSHTTQYVLLKNDPLNPGDKFIVCSNKEIYNEKLSDLYVDKGDSEGFNLVKHPVIALNVVSIEDSGKIIYLNSDIIKYEVENTFTVDEERYTYNYKYHILGGMGKSSDESYNQEAIDLDSYRNVLSSGYSVFKSKTSGKLAILAELIMIDSYSVTHSVTPRKDESDNIIDGCFDIVLHTDITPEITETNYNTVPKLQYYYLKNSLGYIQTNNGNVELFKNGLYNELFLKTHLYDVYDYIDSSIQSNLGPELGTVGSFNFPKPNTYHGRMVSYNDYDFPGTPDNTIYTKFTENNYHKININQVKENIAYYNDTLLAKFYYYDPTGKTYIEYKDETINTSYTYYVKELKPEYINAARNTEYKEGWTLYKLATQAFQATEEIMKDTSIEKFLSLKVYSYKVATDEEKASGVTLYYKDDDNTYKSLVGDQVDGVTYYVLKTESNLVSIGYEVDPSKVTDTVYYYPSTKYYEEATKEEIDIYWDFDTYPPTSEEPYGCPITLFYKLNNETFTEATEYQISNREYLGITLYYSTDYILIKKEDIGSYGKDNLLFIVLPSDTYLNGSKFIPSLKYNYIDGYNERTDEFPKNDPLYLYTVSDFIPSDLKDDGGNYLDYQDIKLANIKIPEVVYLNGLDLPFKYDYTIVPCMNYGRLDHLAISNTVDFSKLHAFNLSDFTTWKYRIDNNQLRLTFGADIYDTYETYKVDGLILEFYDCWGFAGSLEILDKKSYSGIFTKIIPLNSLRALSTKKITKGLTGLKSSYVRNINIKETTNSDGNIEYKFNDDYVTWEGGDSGWKGSNITEDDNNDCGTLYSNIVYGVKAYIRRTIELNNETVIEYIKKKEFFLYTLPIYNDYYYTINDFSNLEYPELDLVLTYKLKDKSTRTDYTLDGIIEGFSTQDYANVSNYTQGFYDKSSLDVIKYYKYSGYSELYLEIGLKLDYEDLNISYDPNINELFSCKLKVTTDNDSPFTVNSGVDGLINVNSILNYNEEVNIDEDINLLGFTEGDTDYSLTKTVSVSDFRKANFINIDSNIVSTPIKINYLFVVGYTANISDIRNTLVQATTICALFHKTPTGEYNYEDFGVYEQIVTENGNDVKYLLSNIMFYNEGTSETEIFGICKLTAIDQPNMIEECLSITAVETEAKDIKTAGKLNTGEPLKQLVGNIGKLTFCQPHAHGLSEENGVNIHDRYDSENYGIAPEVKVTTSNGSEGVTKGIMPKDYLFLHPKYNMCLNTKNMINYYSEFISTLEYDDSFKGDVNEYQASTEKMNLWATNVQMRKYTGLKGSEIAVFNTKMINTMSLIYAYNPDYDSLTVNVGDVTLQSYNPNFYSNLLSYESSITYPDNTTLNDYIYLGPIKFSTYLQYMNIYSGYSLNNSGVRDSEGIKILDNDSNFLPLIQLTENLDYCGYKDNHYLISTLTYNTPVPKELETDLEFSSSDKIVVKHTNGENSFLEGTPNKKTLYGYSSEYKKMILLDVTNYSIDVDGNLILKNVGNVESKEKDFVVDSLLTNTNLFNGYSYFTTDFVNSNGETDTVLLCVSIDRSFDNVAILNIKEGTNGYMLGFESSNISNPTYSFNLTPKLTVLTSSNKNNYSYTTQINSIELECNYMLLKTPIHLLSYPSLYQQSAETLSQLISTDLLNILLQGYQPAPNTSYLVGSSYELLSIKSTSTYWVRRGNPLTISLDDKNKYLKFNYTTDSYLILLLGLTYVVGLLEIRIKNINYTITLTSKLETSTGSFISTTRTSSSTYSEIVKSKYTVKEDYKDTRLKGSSITLNDLLYEPNADGHRLFMRNNLCSYNNAYRGKIYYRFLNTDNGGHDSWNYKNTKYLNNIFMFTGPCYTSDNLNE